MCDAAAKQGNVNPKVHQERQVIVLRQYNSHLSVATEVGHEVMRSSSETGDLA